MKLSDLATIKTNFKKADFWVVRRGTLQAVGSVTRSFYMEHIGIKVVRVDILLPDYLYYAMMDLHSRGYYRPLATGTLQLVHIRVRDIKNITIG